MTNTSNLNLSKGTIPPLLKYKIVFLGDQAVGKSSIINRFIYDIFDGNEHVLVLFYSYSETHNWNRLHFAEHFLVIKNHQIATMGYCGSIKI